MKRAPSSPLINPATIQGVRIAFDAEHCPSAMFLDLRNGTSIEADKIYSWQPERNRSLDEHTYTAYEGKFGRSKEVRVRVLIADESSLERARGAAGGEA